MLGVLLENSDGILGLVVIDEVRKIKNVTYLAEPRNLQITFDDKTIDTLQTEIDPQFESALLAMKDVLVGHFAANGLEGEPSDEYYAPLTL